jgi:hypothetical protein
MRDSYTEGPRNSGGFYMDWDRFLEPPVLGLMIPILALVYWIIHTILKHRERMALIERGIHPDLVKGSKKD